MRPLFIHNSHPFDLCPNPTPYVCLETLDVTEPINTLRQNLSTRRYGYQAALYTDTDSGVYRWQPARAV